MKSSICFSRTTSQPLSVYFTELEATNAANYANQCHGHDFVPYQCERCEHWHLAPKHRHTPSKTCFNCTGGDGKNKQLYPTYQIAKQRAEILFQEKGKHLKLYECPFNKGWHLTKNHY
ncbi:hypothetical protein [Photobacterium sanguinicancri]|uniref:hypothetical protein n=1 Tax=Photobacterium sanguinicancri TaxID=875932 RepID=UPI0021C2CB26|nr:hypothetical protein [Photobacterium sanguinicancri]